MIGNLAKIFDLDNNRLGKGHVLSLNLEVIKIKGVDLPILDSKTNIIIEIYNEFTGRVQYFCEVRVAALNQLNAKILRQNPVIERRQALKVRTDLSFYIESLYRNGENVTADFPNMKINVLNLSIGGMLISSNYKLFIDDIITFSFKFGKNLVILLKAKLIRIDKEYDNNTKQLSILNYGCVFEQMPPSYENIITKYLYKRHLQLYKNKKE